MTNSYDPFMEVTVDNPNALTEAEAEQERELSLELEADRTQIDANRVAEQEQRKATQAQAAAEVEDPRNKKKWGVGEVIKETTSAIGGGLQDTASSLITAPERIIDFFTGEMERENKAGGYKPEWDDFFVNDENPIETKTWWGGLIRGLTHFGTLAAVPLPGGALVKGLTGSSKAARAAGLVKACIGKGQVPRAAVAKASAAARTESK